MMSALVLPVRIRHKGGAGSGNWGHGGLPGVWGGSSGTTYHTIPIHDSSKMRQIAMEGRKRDPTNDEDSALSYYTGDGYIHINTPMRNGEEISSEHQKYADDLRSFVESGTFPDDLMVYRGIGKNTEIYARFDDITPGTTITDNGFMSTSLDWNQGKEFAGYYGSIERYRGVLMNIQVPRGTPGGFTNNAEREVLLRPGTKLKVISTERVQVPEEGGIPSHERLELTARVVDDGQ